MLFQKKPTEPSGLDKAINEIFSEMQGFTADSDEYSQMADQLTKLYALKAINRPDRISRDTLVLVLGNVVGIAVIVGYERANVVTSKAIHLLLRLR